MNKYHYTECGLDNVWLCNGFTQGADEYGEWTHIDNVEGLHRAIGEALVGKCAPLTGSEIRFLRIEMDLTQKALGELLGREAQTVALWEKKGHITRETDYLIRHIYREVMGENPSYVDSVRRLQAQDQQEYDELRFREDDSGWHVAA